MRQSANLLIRPHWALFLGLGICLTTLAQQPAPPPPSAGQAPEPIPTLKQPAPTKSEADTIAEHVQTGKDEFLSELYDEEIKEQLAKLKKLLKHKPLERAKLALLIASEFRGTPLRPAQRTRLRDTPPTVERYEPDPKRSVTARSLPRELEGWLADLAEISHIELKTTAISIEETEPPRVQVQIRYDFTGHTAAQEIRQLTGYWMTQWRKHPSQGWLWRGLVVEEGWEGRTPRPHFTDITACAVGKGPAYQQLLRGLSWYSAHLDFATGAGLVGFNGLAVADIDADGDEDFYVCQPAGLPNRLFRANADGTFSEIARAAGLDVLDHSAAAVFFDYDNDADADLLLTGTRLLLFQNDGKGRFTFLDPKRVGLSTSTDANTSFYSACIADYNRDGWLDVYVCAYDWQAGEGSYASPLPIYDATNGPPNFLFRNNGDGTFTEVAQEVGLDENSNRFSLACAWADYDRDGYPDLYVANDFGRNNLYRNEGGRFRDVAAEAGVEDMGFGMSSAWEDYDNDGWLDLYVANMWSSAGLRTTMQPVFRPGSQSTRRALYRRTAKGNSLYRNRGDGTFEEVTEPARVALGRWAWSSQFFDLDLDGREDIFVTNGYVTNESTKDL
ncbi:MAG: FG-GAP repeat domain-containing protein [Terriglobia bacterium]